MRYGGTLDRSIIKIVKNWENESGWELFPRQSYETYFYLIEARQQFRQLHDKHGNLIAYADYWLFRTDSGVEEKFWLPMWPLYMSLGDVMYVNWAWVHPEYERVGIAKMFLKDALKDFPDKTIYFHRVKNGKEILLKFSSLKRAICQT